MKHYANDKEDLILYETGVLPKKGVFVDVGAGPDGIQGSNTYFYEKLGWKGVCIDANSANAEALKKNRKCAYSALVTNNPGIHKFYFNPSDPDTAGTIPTKSNNKEYVYLEGVTLESILEKEGVGEIDLISIDTEGTELDVWRSMDWKKHKPKVVIVESVSQREINVDIIPELEKLGYSYKMTIGPNLVFQYVARTRNPHLMIYGSSYDRGLEHLLKMWPDIKKAVLDAELHIFYGWNLFEAVYKDNPERMAWKDKMDKLMEQPGITHLGRISHAACIVEHEKAGIWAYPTHFGEISCITAMRAQVYGSVPCVINYAALKETVKWGVKIEGDIYEPEVKKLYCDALIGLLHDEKYQEEVRKKMMPEARMLFSWRNVALQWSEEFNKVESPDNTAMKLIMQDQPIEALKILKEGPLRKKLIEKLAHMSDEKLYKQKYADDPMNWKPELLNKSYHDWILKEAEDAKNLIDLGPYEGSLLIRAKEKGIKTKGVEMCKAAVRYVKSKGIDAVEGDALTYQDGDRYDAVCCCEVVEHVPSATRLIENMLSLVSDTGWCYMVTPNGPIDLEGTKKVWNTKGALIDHVRCFDKGLMSNLLAKYENKMEVRDRWLCVKFRRSIEKEVGLLMEDNQALKAWDLIKNTNSPLKDRVWLRVKHAFNHDDYIKYYSEDLIEEAVSEEIALDCTQLYPRFKWLVEEIEKAGHKKVLDLGCADGYLCLTLAKRGKKCIGFNLYEPSIKIAEERAKKHKLDARFIARDLFDAEGHYDAVVLFEVLEHLPDPKKAIDHCMKLVRKNGSFYISTPSQDSLGVILHKQEEHESWDDGKPSGHLRLFTADELAELLKDYKIKQFVIDTQGNYLMEVKHK